MTINLERPDTPGGLVLERPDVDWTRDQYGRPRVLPDPRWLMDGEYATPPAWLDAHGDLLPSRPYTRVTTFGEALQDSSALTRWKGRRILLGASRRPDYVTAAAALTAEDRDRDALNDLAEKCLEAAGPNAADLGTALHGFTERVDRGEPLGFVPDQYRADVDAYREATAGFRWLQRECRMVCDQLETAGTPDGIAVVDLPDPDGVAGVPRIVDVKTGQVDYTAGKFATQLATYARSHLYDPATGERSDVGADRRWGLIVHLPIGTGTCELLWIDLQHGWRGALLCGPVREWRQVRSEQLLVPVGGRPQPATCTGHLASGAPCTARAKGNGLCGRHQAQAPVQTAAADPGAASPGPSTAVEPAVDTAAGDVWTDGPFCRGKLQDGRPCVNLAGDSGFCGRHQAQAPVQTAAAEPGAASPGPSTAGDNAVDVPTGAGRDSGDLAVLTAPETPEQDRNAQALGLHPESMRVLSSPSSTTWTVGPAPEQNGNPTPHTSMADPDAAAAAEREAEQALVAMIDRAMAGSELELLWQSTHQQWTPAVKAAASRRREYLATAPQRELQSAGLLAAIAAVDTAEELHHLWQSPGVDQVWTAAHTEAAKTRLEQLTGG